MGYDSKGFDELIKKIEKANADTSKIMKKIVLNEGVRYSDIAKLKTKKQKKVSSTLYMRSWHSSSNVRVKGQLYEVSVGNSANYAKHLEYGFRSHFVPGFWSGKLFVYDRKAKKGMIVGEYAIKATKTRNGRVFKRAVPTGYVEGTFINKKTMLQLEKTRNRVVKRLLDKYLKEVLK